MYDVVVVGRKPAGLSGPRHWSPLGRVSCDPDDEGSCDAQSEARPHHEGAGAYHCVNALGALHVV